MTPGDLGFVLQNRGALFALDDDHLNRLEPHKRPFHTIIPAMVTKDDKPWLCFGVMGGDMQPQGHVQVLGQPDRLWHERASGWRRTTDSTHRLATTDRESVTRQRNGPGGKWYPRGCHSRATGQGPQHRPRQRRRLRRLSSDPDRLAAWHLARRKRTQKGRDRVWVY